MTIYVAGTGVYHPEERITNADLERMVATTDKWIVDHIGIKERRKAPKDWMASDLGAEALRQAIEHSTWDKDEIDLLVCANSTPDTLVPSTACHIGHKLGISPPAFDVNAACAGFVYGLGVVGPMLETGRYKRVALVAAEHYTRYTNYEDRATCVFWGDAGACVLLQSERPACGFRLVDWDIQAMTEGTPFVRVPVHGFVEQDGPTVKKYALKGFMRSATTILERNGLSPQQMSAFVGHQANYRLLESVVSELGIEKEKHWHTVQLYGNQGAAGAPATLIRQSEETPLKHGEYLLMTVFGAGFTMASAIFQFLDQR